MIFTTFFGEKVIGYFLKSFLLNLSVQARHETNKNVYDLSIITSCKLLSGFGAFPKYGVLHTVKQLPPGTYKTNHFYMKCIYIVYCAYIICILYICCLAFHCERTCNILCSLYMYAVIVKQCHVRDLYINQFKSGRGTQ